MYNPMLSALTRGHALDVRSVISLRAEGFGVHYAWLRGVTGVVTLLIKVTLNPKPCTLSPKQRQYVDLVTLTLQVGALATHTCTSASLVAKGSCRYLTYTLRAPRGSYITTLGPRYTCTIKLPCA